MITKRKIKKFEDVVVPNPSGEGVTVVRQPSIDYVNEYSCDECGNEVGDTGGRCVGCGRDLCFGHCVKPGADPFDGEAIEPWEALTYCISCHELSFVMGEGSRRLSREAAVAEARARSVWAEACKARSIPAPSQTQESCGGDSPSPSNHD